MTLLMLLAGAAALHIGNRPQEVPAAQPRVHPYADRGPAPAPTQAPEARGFLGVIVAGEAVELSTTLEGRLESLRVQLGDRVRRGEVIATLDSRALRRELAIVEAQLLSSRAEEEAASYMKAEAAEKLQRRDEPRQLQTGAISEEELAAARYQERMATARLNGARALVRQHEARVEQLRQRLSEATLVAPFDAVVGSRYVDPGAVIASGRPIVHLLRVDEGFKVRFAIPEKQASGIVPGLPVAVKAMEQPAHLKGRIVGLAPEVDTGSRMLFAIAALEEPPGSLLPAGTVVRVAVVRQGLSHP